MDETEDKYQRQLVVLSNLRKLHAQTVQTLRNMSNWITEEEMEADILFIEGEAKGISKANLLGIKKALRSGELTMKLIVNLFSTTEAYVLEVKKQLENEGEALPEIPKN